MAFVFDACNCTFPDPAALEEHSCIPKATPPPVGPPFICGLCGRLLQTKSGWTRHVRADRRTPRQKFTCLGCGKEYRHSSSLRRHNDVCGAAAQVARAPNPQGVPFCQTIYH
ncbi:hypothetical protein Zmor_004036 [Zophobas morio]|uniref:C2H2-type domain-containing protein n=1 Tax=Zophobas morio TaxID=2755281 RepID=A0AA38HL16_9CUCU|nr:hypothetical protein Zmor_004036 [Zophobas morio]